MPTLKDLLSRLSSRSEVEAVYIVGQDGLLIDHAGPADNDAEAVAAMAPNLLQNGRELGLAAGHEGLRTAVVEYDNGVVIVSDISTEMILVSFVRPGVPFGSLLYELRHNREQIAQML